jgi:N utilization substance protein B
VRRKARERALQFLFGLEFTNCAWEEAFDRFWSIEPARATVKQYARVLVRGVFEHRDALDHEISACLQNWAPERVGRVERNILRIALYEMRHEDDVPPAVAINEAIELAKEYGTDEAPRFINGVLDRLKEER